MTRSRGKKTIEKKDCWVNYKALAAIQKKLRLSLDSFNKLLLTNSRMLRIKNRLMKNYNKLRRKKRGLKRRRPNKWTQKNNKSYVFSKNWTVFNY